jgi:hypothetical protein
MEGPPLMDFTDHSKLPDGFRNRPDGRGGLAYVKTGNEILRAIPGGDRLLEVVCHESGSRRGGPRLIAIVTKDWQLRVVNNSSAGSEPGRIFTQCRCGPEGHAMSLAKIVAQVELIGHRSAKGRRVDVHAVT